MATIYLKRVPHGLAIADGDLLDGWKLGDILRADIVKPRNGGLHRKAFSLLKVLHPHTDYASIETLRQAMTLGAGYVDTVVNPMTGNASFVPRSWSFKGMDDMEFEAFYNRLIDVALKLLPGSTRDDWEAAEREIIGF
jgi:hypothetical protein